MEFKIYNPQEEGFLKEIDWNYEELKTEIQGKANEDRKSTRLNSSHTQKSRMPSSA